MENAEKSWSLLPGCHKEAENLDIIFACDGAASVGQIANYVAIELTNRNIGVRMCCTSALGAGSETHISIARRAKKNIIINGCASRCVSKIFERLGIKIDYEFVIQDMGVKKIPTLDIDEDEAKRVADEIARKVGYTSNE
ncbi:MAG: putative zinc-binding protein [Candidatus Hydrothermia bacterium]